MPLAIIISDAQSRHSILLMLNITGVVACLFTEVLLLLTALNVIFKEPDVTPVMQVHVANTSKLSSYYILDNQDYDDFTECSQAMFTDFHDQQHEDKENQGFPSCSQSILQKSIPQDYDDFTECSQAMFTDFHDQQNEDKENQGFPSCSQSILQKSIPKKRPFTESRNSCNVVSNNSSDTSIEEILDSDEDKDIKRKNVMRN